MMVETQATNKASQWRIYLTLVGIMTLAAVVRLVALDRVPPGLAPDEAINGYDAYSLLLTGRDHHGVLFPLVMRSLNDYRMPLFIYSIVPFVGWLGLTVTAVRMAAAFWGILTVPVAYWLGRRMSGPVAGLVSALLVALSPWSIAFSRMGFEWTLAAFVVALMAALLWEWQATSCNRWLIGAGAVASISLYAYSTTKLFAPAFALLVCILWGRRVWAARKIVLVTALVAGIIALPMVYLTLRYPTEMQARYQQITLFQPGRPWHEAFQEAVKIFFTHLSPGFLFVTGDLDTLQHPPLGGQLYWVQAPLLFIGLGLMFKPKYRPAVLFTVVWVLLAAVPPALTRPNLSGSGHAARNVIALVPLQLLSALAMGWLAELKPIKMAPRAVLWGGISIALWVNAGWFLDQYFTNYAPQVSGRFEDGMQQVIETMQAVEADYPEVVFSDRISWPYVYVLFFTRYDPWQLQANPPERSTELFAPVTRMGKYRVSANIDQTYLEVAHGLFIVSLDQLPEAQTLAIIQRPSNGEPFCKLVVK